MVLLDQHKFYNPLYNGLVSGEYIFVEEEYGDYKYRKKDDLSFTTEVTYESTSNRIILPGFKTLSLNFISIFDFYTVYWYFKLNSWFKKYKGVDNIVVIKRDQKIESLLS